MNRMGFYFCFFALLVGIALLATLFKPAASQGTVVSTLNSSSGPMPVQAYPPQPPPRPTLAPAPSVPNGH